LLASIEEQAAANQVPSEAKTQEIGSIDDRKKWIAIG